MITVRSFNFGSRCDMCFKKTQYEILADDRYNERNAFSLHLCKDHAIQLAKNIYDVIKLDEKE